MMAHHPLWKPSGKKKHERLRVQANKMPTSDLNFAERPGNTGCCDLLRPLANKTQKIEQSWI